MQKKQKRSWAKTFGSATFFAVSMLSLPAFADNGLDEETLALIGKLSTTPQLINESYLTTVLGNPTTSAGQPGSPATKYWYRQGTKGPKYELTSFTEQSGNTGTTFIINHPSKTLDFEDVEKIYGKNPLRRFDQYARPTETYSFCPNTSLIFTKPQNTFRIEKVSINYSGPQLPPPSVFDIQAASDGRKQQILGMHEKGQHWQSIPQLVQHVKDNPGDAEMHYHLARAYKQSCLINQAVAEYSNALYLCTPGTQDNQDLSKLCMEGLAELKMHPLTPDQLKEYHNYSLFQNEQRLKEGRMIAKNMPGVKHAKPGPYDYIEEIDPPASHFVPGTLVPKSSVATGDGNYGMPQSAPALVPLRPSQGMLKLEDLKPAPVSLTPSSHASTAQVSTNTFSKSAGVTLMPNGEPF